MKNVTVTLPEDILSRARIRAAQDSKSMSRFISDLLAQHVGRPMTQGEAVEKFLSGPLYPGLTENLPSREELYAERLFHRHERIPVRPGPENADEAGSGKRMDHGVERKRTTGRKSPGPE